MEMRKLAGNIHKTIFWSYEILSYRSRVALSYSLCTFQISSYCDRLIFFFQSCFHCLSSQAALNKADLKGKWKCVYLHGQVIAKNRWSVPKLQRKIMSGYYDDLNLVKAANIDKNVSLSQESWIYQFPWFKKMIKLYYWACASAKLTI